MHYLIRNGEDAGSLPGEAAVREARMVGGA